MSTENKLFQIELALFLAPVVALAIPGLLYMFITPLGDLPYLQTSERIAQFIILEVLTLFSCLALISLSLAAKRYMQSNKLVTFSNTPLTYILLLVGISISFLAAYELANSSHAIKEMLGIKENTAYFVLYTPGLLACIPTLHLLIMSRIKSANKRMQSVAAEPRL